ALIPLNRLFFFQAEDGIRAFDVTGVQTCALPIFIVRPMPQLTLDYFLTEHVFGDDAFTPAIEPPVPYTLGVRIANNGAGLAKSEIGRASCRERAAGWAARSALDNSHRARRADKHG